MGENGHVEQFHEYRIDMQQLSSVFKNGFSLETSILPPRNRENFSKYWVVRRFLLNQVQSLLHGALHCAQMSDPSPGRGVLKIVFFYRILAAVVIADRRLFTIYCIPVCLIVIFQITFGKTNDVHKYVAFVRCYKMWIFHEGLTAYRTFPSNQQGCGDINDSSEDVVQFSVFIFMRLIIIRFFGAFGAIAFWGVEFMGKDLPSVLVYHFFYT